MFTQKKIGRIAQGSVILSGGKRTQDEMKFTDPGIYKYVINFYGVFRGRDYEEHGVVSIVITANHEIKLEK